MRRAWLSGCLLLVLSACSHHHASPPAAAIPAPAPPAPGTSDGFWRGSSTRFQAEGRGCPSPGLVNAQVMGGQFDLRWGARATIAVVIAHDGKLSGQGGDVSVTGTYTGSAITADATSPNCGLHFTLHRAA